MATLLILLVAMVASAEETSQVSSTQSGQYTHHTVTSSYARAAQVASCCSLTKVGSPFPGCCIECPEGKGAYCTAMGIPNCACR